MNKREIMRKVLTEFVEQLVDVVFDKVEDKNNIKKDDSWKVWLISQGYNLLKKTETYETSATKVLFETYEKQEEEKIITVSIRKDSIFSFSIIVRKGILELDRNLISCDTEDEFFTRLKELLIYREAMYFEEDNKSIDNRFTLS